MEHFVTIDFETANRARDSACGIGMAVVEGGRITDRFSSLIQPPGMAFDDDLTRIHGITAESVRDAPTFDEVWPEVRKRCGCGIIVAHNAAFDVGVIRASADRLGLDWLPDRYACTVKVARSVLPGLPNHKLHTLAHLFGIELDHHDALSDAVVCAELAICLFRLAGPDVIDSYCQPWAGFAHSTQSEWRFSGASVRLSMRQLDTKVSRLPDEPMVDVAEADGRFEGKRFVFTGQLVYLQRTEARAIVEQQGGRTVGSVSKKTDVVVVGDDVLDDYKTSGKTTSKLAKALAYQESGLPLCILGESEFIVMIG